MPDVTRDPYGNPLRKVVDLNSKRPPVTYTVHLTHHWDGNVEAFVENVSDDEQSQRSVREVLIRWAMKHMTADHIHFTLLDRIDALMSAEADTPECTELRILAAACEAYETEKGNAR